MSPRGQAAGFPALPMTGKYLALCFNTSLAMSYKGAFSAIKLIFCPNFSTDASMGLYLWRRGLSFTGPILKPPQKLMIKEQMTYVTSFKPKQTLPQILSRYSDDFPIYVTINFHVLES